MELNELFYQHYWWFLISLLGAILVFLLFVQGGQSLLATMGKNEIEKSMMVNSLGRKWEFTFTTLVVFGGAFFASFPLFYSTSFGGAYWLWMAILFSFIIQAVSYEYRSKSGNFLGKKTYDAFLFVNGVVGPLLLGVAVGTFFTGADFIGDDIPTKADLIGIARAANGSNIAPRDRNDIIVNIPDGVESVSVVEKVWSTPNTLHIITGSPVRVEIFNILGKKLASQEVNGETAFAIPSGIYLVKAGNHTGKYIVK